MSKLLEAALGYVAFDWRVLKCRSRDKRPATTHGVKDASVDTNIIRGWFEQDTHANLGIATGNGLIVLDVDPRNGGTKSLEKLINQHGNAWLETATVITGGGGKHYYFSHNSEVRSCKSAKGLDLQADGYYVIAPPSTHPSGNCYKWDEGKQPDICQLLSLPEFLLPTKSNNPEQPHEFFGMEDIVVRLKGTVKGQRNNNIFRYACSLRAKGITYEEAKYLVDEIAASCEPPLDEAETLKCLNSAWTYLPNFKCTDTGNAKRLVNLHGENLLYVPEFKCWMHWDGGRWLFDQSYFIERIAKETTQMIYTEASAGTEEIIRKDKARWAINSESAPRLRSMIELARSEPGIATQQHQLDSDSMILGITNGTLELRSGMLRESRREDLITKRASVLFNSDVTCPTWIAFLNTIMGGDQDLILFLKKMTGYMLTGDTGEHCIFIAYGLGANGKSTFANVLKILLGDYCMTTPPDTLMIRRYSGGATPELASLRGERLVLVAESEERSRLAESLLKQMTGQDTISARPLYCSPFEYTPIFKILLSTNHRPIIRGDDNAIWRRIRLIPFNVTIPPSDQDKNLLDKLLNELPGILNWAIEGCLEWQHNGLSPPPQVMLATQEYRDDMDIVGTWIDECCIISNQDDHQELFTPTNILYASYDIYCKDAGLRPVSKNAFSRKLQERGFERIRTSKIRQFKGISLCGTDANGGAFNLDTVFVGGRAVGILKDGLIEKGRDNNEQTEN